MSFTVEERLIRPDPERYEGQIYQMSPFLKWITGFWGRSGFKGFWLLSAFGQTIQPHYSMPLVGMGTGGSVIAAYDETQRVPKQWPPEEVEIAWGELDFWEKINNAFLCKAGIPYRRRPWPWKDSYERMGFMPEEYWKREWKQPRRTFYNKWIPPPKEGVYEDNWHMFEHMCWAQYEWMIVRQECNTLKQELNSCLIKNWGMQGANCGHIWDAILNWMCKTNADKNKMTIWSGAPAVKDGGFKVRWH